MAVSDPVRSKQKGIEQRVNRRCYFALILMCVRLQEEFALAVAQEIHRHASVLMIPALSHILTISPLEALTLH
jgi:hypothetical protein